MAAATVAFAQLGDVVRARRLRPRIRADRNFVALGGLQQGDRVARLGVQVVDDELVDGGDALGDEVGRCNTLVQTGKPAHDCDVQLVTREQRLQCFGHVGVGCDVGERSRYQILDESFSQGPLAVVFDPCHELKRRLAQLDRHDRRRKERAVDDLGPVEQLGEASDVEPEARSQGVGEEFGAALGVWVVEFLTSLVGAKMRLVAGQLKC